jgi:hypothetical protein
MQEDTGLIRFLFDAFLDLRVRLTVQHYMLYTLLLNQGIADHDLDAQLSAVADEAREGEAAVLREILVNAFRDSEHT